MDTPAQALTPHLSFAPNPGERWKVLLEKQAEALAAKAVDTDALIDAAIEWDARIRDKRIELYIKRHFWGKIEELSGCDLDYVFDILEEKQAKEKQRKHDEALEHGLYEATKLLDELDFHQAKTRIQQAITDADNAVADRPIQPIINVCDGLPALRQQLRLTQGLKHTGLIQGALPELDEQTFGFEGLTLISATSGGGKTMLTIQTVLEILQRYDDTCCLFVSADMTADRVLLRMLTNRTRLPIRTVKTGTGPNGWTDDEQILIRKGVATLETIGRRCRVVDRFSFPNPTRANIHRQAAKLMDDTGCEKCILVIDFLEILPVPEGERNPDQWLIEEMRTLADNGYTIFCICESGKSETNYQRGSAKNIKGDYRKIMRSDIVLTINVCTDDELLDMYDISAEGYVSLRASKEPFDEANPKKRARQADRTRKALKIRGQVPSMIKIDKGRDGAECGDLYVVNHFRRNYFTPLS